MWLVLKGECWGTCQLANTNAFKEYASLAGFYGMYLLELAVS
jgi:hypothetical protein